jgi:hypothetical protein
MREWKCNSTAVSAWVRPSKEILDWCRDNIEDKKWDYAFDTIYFVREKDYTFFMLRWES